MAIKHLLNVMKQQSEATLGGYSHPRFGTITSYKQDSYVAKVLIQPEQIETGYLPICTPWVGNGWGMFCPPASQDMVLVLFQEGNFEAGIIVLSAFNNVERPLPVNSGEFWLVNKLGSSFKLKNDGSIEVIANQDLNLTANGETNINSIGNVNVTTPLMNLNGNLNVNGEITSTGNISSDANISAGEDMSDGAGALSSIRGTFNGHTHPDPEGGNTGIPNQQM